MSRKRLGMLKLALPVGVATSLVIWLMMGSDNKPMASSSSELNGAPPAFKNPSVNFSLTVGAADKMEAKVDVDPRRFTSFNNWLKEWEGGRADLKQGLDLARERKRWMQQAIKEDPELAYRHALKQDIWSKLPKDIQAEVEHRFSGEGKYEVTRDCETDLVWRQLTMNDFSTGNAIIASKLADRNSFTGVMKGVTLGTLSAVVAMEGGGTPIAGAQVAFAAPEPTPVTGTYKVLWLNIKMNDEVAWPTTDSAATTSLSSVATNFNTFSYGQLTINHEVLSVSIAANKAESPSDSTIMSQANAAAVAAGKVLSNYRTVLYRQTLYGQYAGLSNNPGYVMLSKVAVDTTTHEIAHNMGVHHANWWKANAGQPAWGAGVNTLYGEDWDAMALDAPRGDFNVPEKVQLGWLALDTDYVHDVGSGVYRIYDSRNRTRNFNTAGVNGAYYGVSVYKDSETTNGEYGPRRYMLSYRDRTAVGTTQMTPGLCLHWPRWTYNGSGGYNTNGPYGSNIIDTHPTINNVNDAPLAIGETYIDNDPGNLNGDIFITPLSKADPDGIPQNGDEYLDVKIVVGDQLNNASPVAGTLTFAKSIVGPGEPAVMTVTASDPDGDTLAYFWDFGLGTTMPARQAMATNGATSQQFTYASTGTYTVKVTVSDCRGGTVQLTKTITVSNTPPAVSAGVDQLITLGSSAAPWTPADIATIVWYDAADAATVVQSSNAVSSWNDKSGNNRHVLQATSTKKPTYNTTGWDGARPSLSFDGGDALTSAAISNVGAGERTVFIVYNSNATPVLANQYLLDMKGATEQFYFAVSAGVPKLIYKGSATSTAITTGVNGKHVAAFGNDARTRIYKDGTLGVDDAINQTTTNTITSINVGSRSGSEYFEGSIAEMIIVPFTMTDIERQVMEGYLAHKWSLTANLPATHPYKTAAPGQQRATADLSGSVTDINNGQLLNYKWSPVSGPAPFSIRNPLLLNPNVVFTAPGTYTLRLTASDSYDQSFEDLIITVNPPPVASYTAWSAGTFAHPFTQTSLTQNPDGDEWDNRMEFAFGTDPTSGRMGDLAVDGSIHGSAKLVSNGGGSSFDLYFIRRKDYSASGSVTYTVQFSGDLITFHTVATAPTFVVNSAVNSEYEVVKVPYPALLPDGKVATFGRIGIASSP